MSQEHITSHSKSMTSAECIERLGYGSYVGRIGFVNEDRVSVLPINYLLDGSTIVFRTAEDSVLGKLDGVDVAFEVDSNQPLEHSGWSVLAHGKVTRLTEDGRLERLRRGALRAWAWQTADHWFGIDIAEISGRVIGDIE